MRSLSGLGSTVRIGQRSIAAIFLLGILTMVPATVASSMTSDGGARTPRSERSNPRRRHVPTASASVPVGGTGVTIAPPTTGPSAPGSASASHEPAAVPANPPAAGTARQRPLRCSQHFLGSEATPLGSDDSGLDSGDPGALLFCPPDGPVSDEFHAGALNTSLWTFVNPLGDGTVTVNGTNALISLPAGASHDVWVDGNNAPRIMQTTSNIAFEVEVKFDSMVAADHQLQGVIVEQDSANFIRFGIYYDGTSAHLFAATFVGGVPTVQENTPLCVGPAPFWLRVKRAGDTWSQSWSTLGTSFMSGIAFDHALTVRKIGAYAGNVPDETGVPPAFTVSIDYFFNTASPIVPEDGAALGRVDALRQGSESSAARDSSAAAELDSRGTANRAGQIAAAGHAAALISSAALSSAAGASRPDEDPIGPPGPTIDVWYGSTQTFGQNGRPQEWINVLGNVSDIDGVSSLTYRLNGGSPQALSIGPDPFRLVDPGDFNVEIAYASLLPGANSVLVTAVDGLGNGSTRTVTVNFIDGQTWPHSYTINWATAGSIGAVAQITDGKWAIEPGGAVRTMQTGYDRLITVGEMNTWDNYEITAEVTMHSLDCAGDFGVGIVAGWKGHTGDEQPRVGHPFPGLGWYAKFPATTAALNLYENTTLHPEQIIAQDTSGRVLLEGLKYIFKFRVETISASASRFSLKVWPAATTEPASFDLVSTGERSQGSIVLGAHRADVSFGTVTVTGL